MTWTEQTELIIKVATRFEPLIVRELKRIYRIGLDLYRQGRADDVQQLFFDQQFTNLIIDLYVKSGVPMARFVVKKMPTVRQLEKKNGQMGISKEWLNRVRSYLGRYALEFVSDILGTAREDMIKLFQKATEEGWSYERLARELLNSGLALRRARVIARTEAHRGAMAGSMEGARSLPYEVQKEWLSANDSRVRRTPKARFDHAELNGQIRDLEKPFNNEEEIMQPGDPKASAGNTIQCRCVTNYIPKRDERGRLILKR